MTRRDPDRRRRLLQRAKAKKAAKAPEQMTDEEFAAWFVTDPHATPEPTPVGSPMAQWMGGLSDDELLAVHEEAQADYARELASMTDEELSAVRTPEGQAERERRLPKPTPAPVIVPVPPTVMIEPHAVTLEEPKPTAPPETPREAWQRKQHEGISAAIADEMARAAREHESTQRLKDVGTYDGPSLGEMLRPNRG